MTRPPSPSKAAAVAALVTAIVGSAEHARTLETPLGAHIEMKYHTETCTDRTHYFPPRIPGEVTYTCYCGRADAGTVVTFAEITSDEDDQREAEQAAEADKARGIEEGIQTWDALGGAEW